MLRVVAEMLIFAAAMFVTGLGMLARRRWAWRGAVMILAYLVTRWSTVGIFWLLSSPVSESVRYLAIGLLPPALLALLGNRFLCAPSNRAVFDAGSVRVLRGALLAAGLAILVTAALSLPAWLRSDS